MAVHESMLVHRSFLYLKVATVIGLAAITAYIIHDPVPRPYGGTWLGYTLGAISAGLVLWLMWFGIKKRSYGQGSVPTRAWLSAHIYLGLLLIVTTTLHSGFQFSLNLHSLAYALCMLTIASGIFGVYAYSRYPTLITQNRRGDTFADMMRRMVELDSEARALGKGMPDDVNRVINDGADQTALGGSVMAQLRGDQGRSAARQAFHKMQALAENAAPGEAGKYASLVTVMGKKAELVERASSDIRFKALMEIWLFFHVPLAFGLLAALVAHVFVVFFMA